MCRYNDNLKRNIWDKALIVKDYDPKRVRKDACGAWIVWDDYGKRDSAFGWEVDHIYPESKLREKNVDIALIDNLDNLRPLNWMNNDSKGCDYPSYQAAVTSDGNKNSQGDYQYTVNKETRNKVEQLFKDYL